jgi:hypothetical protein
VRNDFSIITRRGIIPQTLIISISGLNLLRWWLIKGRGVANLILIKMLLENELLFIDEVETFEFFLCDCFTVVVVVWFGLNDFLVSLWQLLDYLTFFWTASSGFLLGAY